MPVKMLIPKQGEGGGQVADNNENDADGYSTAGRIGGRPHDFNKFNNFDKLHTV